MEFIKNQKVKIIDNKELLSFNIDERVTITEIDENAVIDKKLTINPLNKLNELKYYIENKESIGY